MTVRERHATTNGPVAADVAKPQVLFLAGWGRSGSTLLNRMLGLLPDTVAVGELRDIWTRGVVENRLCGCGAPFLECDLWTAVGDAAFGGWSQLDVDRVRRLRMRLDRPWTYALLRTRPVWFDDALDEYGGVVARLYQAITSVAGARIIVDSSKISTHAMVLRSAGLPVRAVHVTRDSRGVAYSWHKEVVRGDAAESGPRDTMLRYSMSSASGRYVLYNAMAETLDRIGIPTIRVRYEDLVARPADELGRVARHAGVEVPEAAEVSLRTGSITLPADHNVDGNPGRLRSGATVIRSDDAWHQQMRRWDRTVVTAATLPLLARYGYLRATDTRRR